jgi:hypothetical protein
MATSYAICTIDDPAPEGGNWTVNEFTAVLMPPNERIATERLALLLL